MVVSLADTDHDDSTALTSNVGDSIGEASLESSIATNLGIEVQVDEGSVIVAQTTTRSPTQQPTTSPAPAGAGEGDASSLPPSSEDVRDRNKRRRLKIGSVAYGAIAISAIFALVASCVWYRRHKVVEKKTKEIFASGGEVDADIEMVQDMTTRSPSLTRTSSLAFDQTDGVSLQMETIGGRPASPVPAHLRKVLSTRKLATVSSKPLKGAQSKHAQRVKEAREKKEFIDKYGFLEWKAKQEEEESGEGMRGVEL